MSEELIVRYCSPTLAGIKTGNMFSCVYRNREEITENIRRLNSKLVPRGLRILPLRTAGDRVLIYVYRPDLLKRDFQNQTVQILLAEQGYSGWEPDRCVARLARKLCCSKTFPHEIGLFLGYPAEDVRGFMENRKGTCKCVGCWKVYGDQQEAEKRFAKYRKCTKVYHDRWEQGKTIERLTVCKTGSPSEGTP